jgi:hypothetical protein
MSPKEYLKRSNSSPKSPRLEGTARDPQGSIIVKDYNNCEWMRNLQNEDIQDPSSQLGKTFRRRFRVPFPLFQKLMDLAMDIGFKKQPVGSTGKNSIYYSTLRCAFYPNRLLKLI